MKIGLDGQNLLVEQKAGPEMYTYRLYKEIAKLQTQHEFIVYLTEEPNKETKDELFKNNLRFKYKVLKKIFSWTQISLAFELLKNPIDVFFTPVHTIPGLALTKKVAMIHGLEYKVNNQYSKNPLFRIIHPFVLWWTMAFSKKIITPSNATKNAIKKLNWPIVDKKEIIVISEGVDEKFYKRTQHEIKEVKRRFKINDEPYLFYLSTIQPRKNIPRMVEAFADFISENKKYENLQLVLAGKKGWEYHESINAPKKFNVEKNVKFIGHITTDEAATLLSGAHAYISCSLEEGFGLPLVEALACETKAVVSDISAYKEVGSNYPIYVDPQDVSSIKKGINKSFEINFDKLGAKKWVSQFTWEKTAKNVINVLKHL